VHSDSTMVLVLCDLFAPRPLTFSRRFLVPVLEGLLVVLTVSVVLMGALLPKSIVISGAHESGVLGCRGHLDRRHLGTEPDSIASKVGIVMAGSQPGRLIAASAIRSPTPPRAKHSTRVSRHSSVFRRW